jgi:hypothetical protein
MPEQDTSRPGPPKNLHILWRDNRRFQFSVESLQNMSFDPQSWFRYMVMLITGKPALMRVQRQDGQVEEMLVADGQPPDPADWPDP